MTSILLAIAAIVGAVLLLAFRFSLMAKRIKELERQLELERLRIQAKNQSIENQARLIAWLRDLSSDRLSCVRYDKETGL